MKMLAPDKFFKLLCTTSSLFAVLYINHCASSDRNHLVNLLREVDVLNVGGWMDAISCNFLRIQSLMVEKSEKDLFRGEAEMFSSLRAQAQGKTLRDGKRRKLKPFRKTF